jgi:hypothetical protein
VRMFPTRTPLVFGETPVCVLWVRTARRHPSPATRGRGFQRPTFGIYGILTVLAYLKGIAIRSLHGVQPTDKVSILSPAW